MGRARPPAGCVLEALRGAERPPTGRACDAGLRVGPCRDLGAVRGPDALAAAVATSRSAGGGSLLPLVVGLGAPFSQAQPSGAQHQGARLGDRGTSGPACWACPCQHEWAGGARSGRKRASPARSAKRAGTRPGARPGLLVSWSRGGQAGVRTSTGASGKLQGPFPRLQIIDGGSVCCNG